MTHDQLYLEKTPKTADAEIDWDVTSDVTSYIQHNTWRKIFATRNKIRRTGPGSIKILVRFLIKKLVLFQKFKFCIRISKLSGEGGLSVVVTYICVDFIITQPPTLTVYRFSGSIFDYQVQILTELWQIKLIVLTTKFGTILIYGTW